MRIRSIKPEFWKSPALAGLSWEVVHDGPMPRRVNAVAPLCGSGEYVYILTDADGSPIYVGRSFRPADRFTKHRRKPWWSRVENAVIVRVAEGTMPRRRWEVQPNTARFEAVAISELQPEGNIAPPSRKALA